MMNGSCIPPVSRLKGRIMTAGNGENRVYIKWC